MAQASSWWRQLVNQLPGSSLPEFKSRAFKSLASRYFGGLGFWVTSLMVAIAMLIWNWKLWVATSAGVLVMWLVWRVQGWKWQLSWSKLRRIFGGANRQLTIAVASGGLASVSTYTAVSIGVDTDSPWIGAGAMLQGLGTLAIFILLIWQIFGRQSVRDQGKLDRMVSSLAHSDPLKRLIAVRYLTRLALEYDRTRQPEIADYFRLMLDREQPSPIREALLDGLQAFDDVKKLAGGETPLAIPLDLKPVVQSSHLIS